MSRKLMKWLLWCVAIAFILWGLDSLIAVFHGETIMVPVGRGSYASQTEAKGAGGVLFSLFYFLMGVGIIGALRKGTGNRSNSSSKSGLSEEYPYCRWWQNEESWYCEHNPLMKVPYPEDHICSLCKKRIEIISYGSGG